MKYGKWFLTIVLFLMSSAASALGSIRVDIQPAEAVAVGAKWEAMIWGVGWVGPYNSGETKSSFAEGNTPIRFTNVNGWTTPAESSVNVQTGLVATVTGIYISAGGSGATDTQPPTINIKQLDPDPSNDALAISWGESRDNVDVVNTEWRINGGSYTQVDGGWASTNGFVSWNKRDIPLQVGDNLFEVRACDAAGLCGTASATITRPGTQPPPAPVLDITSVTPNHLTENQATEANASSWFDLTIKGNGFQNGAVVFIPGVAHDNVRVNSASEIVVRIKAVYGSSTNPPVPVGDRSVTVKNPDGTRIDKSGVLTVEDLLNQPPALTGSLASPPELAQGAALRVESSWQDPEKNPVVDVTVRYRKLGDGVSPDGPWTEVVIPWLGNNPPSFGATLRMNGDPGIYEYEFKAADTEDAENPNSPRLHVTDWQGRGTFVVRGQPANNQPPALKLIAAPSWVMPGQPFRAELKATDPDFNLKEIQIDWTGNGGTDGMVTSHIAADGEIVAPSQVYNRPLGSHLYWTSTAYDTTGAKSKMVKGSLYIGRPPQSTVQKSCPPSNPSLSSGCRQKSPDKSMVGDPINPATGTQSISYTLLSVRGQQTLAFSLAYDSGLLENGVVGKGWNMGGAQARVEELAQGDVKVHWDAAQSNLFVLQEDGGYLSLDSATRYDTLVKNADATFSLTRQNKAVYSFDSTGNLTEARNAAGQRVTFQRDASGRLERIAEPGSGVFLQYAYNADGLLESVTDSLNRTVRLVYTTGLLTAITDAAGQTTTYTYDAAGRILTAVNAEGTQLFANTYDAQGRVIAQDDGLATTPLLRLAYSEDAAAGTFTTTVTNRDSTTRVYTYDGGYQLLSFQDELGNISRSEYNGSGRPEHLLDAKSRATVVAYDERGNPVKVTDSKGNASLLRYDAHDNLIKIEDAKGNKTLLAYNADNDLISLTNAKNQTTQLAYSAPGVLSSTQSPKGATTRYEYANGLPVKITDAENGVTTLAYDDAGRLESITDAAGKITSLEYDAVNRLVAVTDPFSRTLRFAYNAQDKLVSLTDAKGNVTTREYDANGNLASETNALSQTTRYEYDAEDRLIKVTDAKGHAVQIGYDAAGRVVSGTDALGHTRKIELDAVGNVQRQLDALNQAVATYEYDELDNLVSLRDALGNTSRLEYDALSNLVAAVDPLARVTRFQHDELQRLAQATDALNGNSQQAFDADGNRASFQDPNGNTTGFTHDKKGRVTAIEVADGKVRYTFTADDLLKQVTNARNQARDFSYDAARRLTGWTDADGAVAITYDANDNVLSITDAQGTAAYEYDVLDRVTKYTDVLGNVMAYSYDEVGNLATLTYPGGKVVKYEYDAAGRLVKVSDWANRATAYSYDANGRLLQTAYANGTKETRTYNLAGQMTQKSVQDAAGKLMVQYDYVFDAAGNITEEKLSPAALEAMTENLLANMSPLNFTYGAANRLATVNGEAVTFDADGNMINGPLNGEMQAFQYDSRNRLTGVGVMGYRYDAQNHRVGVSVNGKETTYAINPVPALSQTLVRTQPDGTQTFYVYGLGLIAEERGGAYQVYHYDLRGSTVALSDAQGAVADQFAYSPYGGLLSHSPATVDTPFLYNGRDGVMTDDTGLYYMRARYYNPELRRFVNQDPLLGMVADGQSLNRYAYVTGEPVSFVDPWGLKAHGWYDSENDVYRIEATIEIYGEGANTELAKKWEGAIERYWNGRKYNSKSVIFNVHVFSSDRWFSWTGYEENLINVNKSQPGFQGLVYGDEYGDWTASLSDRMVAHEAGHLFGLGDDYHNYNEPLPGHENCLMGNYQDGSVTSHEIEEILQLHIGQELLNRHAQQKQVQPLPNSADPVPKHLQPHNFKDNYDGYV